MKRTTQLVEYRDSEKSQPLLFGPFVSESVADFFRASLPMPLKGGYCRTRVLQPFTAQEGHTVAQIIRRDRKLVAA
jgi:hypothetical protein